MSIPSKGSRLIHVDGRNYRWRVRSNPTYAQAICELPLQLAIEEASRKEGSVLVVSLPFWHPSNWMQTTGGKVTPSLVAGIIRRAVGGGWQPNISGAQFKLSLTGPDLEMLAQGTRDGERVQNPDGKTPGPASVPRARA